MSDVRLATYADLQAEIQNRESINSEIENRLNEAENEIKVAASELHYTNETPTPATIGGIEKGETFKNEKLKSILDKLLYPYVAPTVTATTTPAGGVFECGTTKTVTAVTAKITKGSADITKVEAFNGSASLGSSTTVSTVNSTGVES